MNKYTVTIEISTYSEDPEEWIIDSIGDQLEEDESLVSCKVERVSKFNYESTN